MISTSSMKTVSQPQPQCLIPGNYVFLTGDFFQAALQQKTTSHQLPSTNNLQDALQNLLFHAGTLKSLPMHTPDLKSLIMILFPHLPGEGC